MDFVNQKWFDRHDALLMARGANSKAAIVSPEGSVIGWATNGGIALPRRRELAVGTRLVRFGSLGMPSMVVQGGWWLDWNQYNQVEIFADKKNLPVTVAVRLLCCVPLEWSTMDIVIQARLKSPLLAYAGAGAPAFQTDKKTGTSEFLDGLPDGRANAIEQLYIPGIANGDVRHDALMFEGFGHIDQKESRSGYIIRPQA